jgi:DUF1680 family protein
VVYCLEEVDNGAQLANLAIPREAHLTPAKDAALFGGVGVITGDIVRHEPNQWNGELYQPQTVLQFSHSTSTFKAIPCCFWANRQPGEMRVWVRDA